MITLQILRSQKGVSQQKIASYLGISRQAYSLYETGQRKPNYEMLLKLSEYFGCTVDDLLRPENERARTVSGTDSLDIQNIKNIIPLPKTKRLPLLGNVSCGEPVYADEQHDLFVEGGAVSDADFCIKASGDSMIGANIFDGDIVFVRNQDVVNNGDIAVVLIGDEATLKRVHYDSENEELALFAENPAYKTMRFRGAELEQIRILGKAIAFQRYL